MSSINQFRPFAEEGVDFSFIPELIFFSFFPTLDLFPTTERRRPLDGDYHRAEGKSKVTREVSYYLFLTCESKEVSGTRNMEAKLATIA